MGRPRRTLALRARRIGRFRCTNQRSWDLSGGRSKREEGTNNSLPAIDRLGGKILQLLEHRRLCGDERAAGSIPRQRRVKLPRWLWGRRGEGIGERKFKQERETAGARSGSRLNGERQAQAGRTRGAPSRNPPPQPPIPLLILFLPPTSHSHPFLKLHHPPSAPPPPPPPAPDP